MNKFDEYIESLKNLFTPIYTPPASPAGYDVNHILEMLALGPRISAIARYASLDPNEYAAAVWLHNTDRPDKLKAEIGVGQDGWKQNWSIALLTWLAKSPFDMSTQNRIVDAVLQHSKRDDEAGDSVLLTSLRIADKVVRFGPLGIMGQPANRGRTLMFYNPENPFAYGSTEDNKLLAVMNDYFRILEWIPMLPNDEARALINPADLAAQITWLRALGVQIARTTGMENRMEDCIRKAMGEVYYDKLAPKC